MQLPPLLFFHGNWTFDSESLPLMEVSLNIHTNMKDEWKNKKTLFCVQDKVKQKVES